MYHLEKTNLRILSWITRFDTTVDMRVCEAKRNAHPPLRSLIFDVDGTLYRQLPVRAGMLLRLLSHCLAAPRSGFRTVRLLREYRNLQEGRRASACATDPIRSVCERLDIDPRWANGCIESWMQLYPLDLIRKAAYRDLVPLLVKAKGAGLHLGVFSDYPAEQKLRALGIDHYFSTVLSAEDPRVQVLKPNPRGILTVVSDLGVQPFETAYIGDRPDVDALAAKNAGVRCFIIRAKEHDNNHWSGVPNYTALARLLGL